MNKLSLIPCVLIILLSSCKLLDSNKVAEKPQPIQQQPIIKPPVKPFTKDTLSSLLTGEFAERRGQFELALKNYVTQANKTKDPQIVERAYQIAHYLNSSPEQLDMAVLWVAISPNNIDANRAAALQLTKNERASEAIPYFEKVLTNTDQLDFLNIANSNLTKKARLEVINSLDRLLITHPNNAQLNYSKAVLLAETGANEQALTTLQNLPDKYQQQSPALSLKVYLLQSVGRPDDALDLLAKVAKENPTDKQLQLTYAHLLISQGKLVEAKQQFAAMMKQYPDDEELRFGYALICIENKEWDEAIDYLKQLIANGITTDVIYFYLATAYYEKGDKDAALESYALVTEGENYLVAVNNMAKILFEKKQITEAQQLLANARKQQPVFIIPLYLFETEELLNLNYTTQAWQLINKALQEHPNNTNLLYSRSLVAEKRNDITQAEQDLRQIIRLEPKNSSAINALGYILANRTSRYKEALQLIQQALKLDPASPAILDSLGWVNYRLGNLAEASKYLQQAYENYPDPEVAAHLGEVLWKQDKQQQAKNIWTEALTKDPQNQTIKETIRRLTGTKDL